MEVKEFLQNIIDEEYKRYLDGVYEESAEIIEDNSNVFINKEDYEALIGGMIFSQILKNDKTIYGTYMDVINENERVVHIVEVNPMIDIKNQTGRVGCELILSTLGKVVY